MPGQRRLWPRPDVRSTSMTWLRQLARLAVLGLVLPLTACVYRIDIQQGNLLDDEDIDQVEVGMTRSQVQFLLGTPMVSDSFHQNRWDYAYSLQRGRSRNIERRWVIVYFENDRVARVERDVPMEPSG